MTISKLSSIPTSLKEIPQPPTTLYIEGTLPDPRTHLYLAVIGSRSCTPYGKRVCQDMIASLKGLPIVIVSGLAIGIDTTAHEAALKAHLPTVAFPGSGLDPSVLHPRTNIDLAKQIVASGGALVSELHPKAKPTPWSFPRRNRLVAGIADTVLVIEAKAKSGTLVTSKLATEYNKNVFAIPHSIYSPTGFGPSLLLRLGACPITSTKILKEELGFGDIPSFKEKDFSDTELLILQTLVTPRSKEELLEDLPFSEKELMNILLHMELKGLIQERLSRYMTL